MSSLAMKTTSTVIPCLLYVDPHAAIEWLCRAFGFERHRVVSGEDGSLAHAELSFGSGMIMIGDRPEPQRDSASRPPAICVVVADADAHHAQAAAAGAAITTALHDNDYGGRSYSCRDLEGNSWYFGTYDPWASGTADP